MDDLRHGMDEHAADDPDFSEPAAEDWHAFADRVSAYGHTGPRQAPPSAGLPETVADESAPFSGEASAADERSPSETASPGEAVAVGSEPTSYGHDLQPVGAEPGAPEPAPERRRRRVLGRRRGDRTASTRPESEAPAPSEVEESKQPKLETKRPKREKREKSKRSKGAKQPKPDKVKQGRGATKLVGLKIGSSQIAAARVVNNGAPELLEIAREPLAPGLVVAGEIRDPEALATVLKQFFDRHKLPMKGVRLGLSNNRIGVRVFEIEGVADASHLDNAIRFRAEEVLPIPLDEALLDYVVLDEVQKDDGTRVHRILLVVAYRDAVDRYLLACRGAGIEVVGIDLEAFALLRSLAAPTDRAPRGGALVAVTIGNDRTTIAVSNGRYCEFTRVLGWGGWSLNVVLARELNMAPSEVEGIKRQLSFAEETTVVGLTSDQVLKAREVVRGALGAFARELVASLHFYQAQPGALGIGEVLLTGGAAHMPGLPEELGRIVGIPIRLGDPLRRLKVGGDVEHVDQVGSFAVAIGLGIED